MAWEQRFSCLLLMRTCQSQALKRGFLFAESKNLTVQLMSSSNLLGLNEDVPYPHKSPQKKSGKYIG